MNVYWHDCGARYGNFGDLMTPLLLERFGIPFRPCTSEDADFFGVGSILQQIPPCFSGTVWTSGTILESSRLDLRNATVLAVRGAHTLDRIRWTDRTEPILGDGGLLAHLLTEPSKCRYTVGLITHYVDYESSVVRRFVARTSGAVLIDSCGPVHEIMGVTSQCRAILSSSLHGLVLADSVGIPNCWIRPIDRDEELIGGDFKFNDYHSVFGLKLKPRVLREGSILNDFESDFEEYSRPSLRRIQMSLLDSFKRLALRYHYRICDVMAPPSKDDFAGLTRRLSDRRAERELNIVEDWEWRSRECLSTLSKIIPSDARCILVGREQLGAHDFYGAPFEAFCGIGESCPCAPADGQAAIRVTERLINERRMTHLAVPWTAFWWFDTYDTWRDYLAVRCRKLVDTDDLVVYGVQNEGLERDCRNG
jgi:polysaccharide pyruvyl transferase